MMVVDRVQHAAGLLGRGAEEQRGFAAVRADFDAGAAVEVAQRGVVERASLLGGHETLDLFGQGEQTLVDVIHQPNLSPCATPPSPWSMFALSDHRGPAHRLSGGRSDRALTSSVCAPR
ncbi:hypothetical protein I549_3603 [Mycobacterium avium subsp. avium 2285 (R)]|nr:hypothetical protein I549_3603 [Mycobacterium avium subsp. avium 2285 (R)]